MGKKKSDIPAAGTVPRDHPEFFGVREVPKFTNTFVTPDPRPDWAKKWRAEMTFEDLRDAMEDMAVGTEESLRDVIERLEYIEDGNYDTVKDLKEQVESTGNELYDHGVNLRNIKSQVTAHDEVLKDMDAVIRLAVEVKVEPLLKQIDDLKVELREAFDLIESLEDVIDNAS